MKVEELANLFSTQTVALLKGQDFDTRELGLIQLSLEFGFARGYAQREYETLFDKIGAFGKAV